MKVSSLFFTVLFVFNLLTPIESFCQQNNLEFIVEIDNESLSRENTSVLNFIFKNNSNEELNILNHFTPFPVFFNTSMQHESGAYLGIPGGGKISFAYNHVKSYITIKPNETHTMKVNLIETLNELKVNFEKGKYSLNICYQNQYGINCENGRYPSETIEIIIQ